MNETENTFEVQCLGFEAAKLVIAKCARIVT